MTTWVLGLACGLACSLAAAGAPRQPWHDQQSPLRRVILLDGTDLKEDLVDFPVELRFSPQDTHLATPDGSAVATRDLQFQPGRIRPALRTGAGGVVQVILPEACRKSEKGWTVECVARDDDAPTSVPWHGRALVSAWPEGVRAQETPGPAGMAASGYKFDPLAWVPAEHRLPLLNLGLVNDRPFSCTYLPGCVWENWQMPLFGRAVPPRKWIEYAATYKPRESQLWVNGEPQKMDYAAAPLPIASLCLGSWDRPQWQWKGLIDSVRVTPRVLSEDWLRARGRNLSCDPRFVVVGPVETRESGAVVSPPPVAVAPVGLLKRYEQPRFRWSSSPGTEEYKLLVWPVATPAKPTVAATVAGTAYPGGDKYEAGKAYAWTVQALPDGVATKPVEFSVPADPPVDRRPLKPPTLPERFVMQPAEELRVGDVGPVADRCAAALANWVLRYPEVNPDILRCLHDHELSRGPHSWWGESFGKFMTGATLFYELTRDHRVRAMLDGKITEAIAAQEADGYLGSYPKDVRLTGAGLHLENWDLYIIHHELTAFLEYYKVTGSEVVLRSAMHLADLVCAEFGPGGASTQDLSYNTSSNNDCILGPMVQLYRLTGRVRYLEMAQKLVRAWEDAPNGPQYLTLAEKGRPLTDLHWGHGFEMTVSFGHALDLYDVTGDERLKAAMLHWWKEMVAHELAVNGNMCPYACEFWSGDPYTEAPMETCAATAFMRFSTAVLMTTGDPKCADQVERSLYNAHLAAQLPDGSEYAITVALNGTREIRPNSHMACCPAWGLTGMSNIVKWGATVTPGNSPALAINYYGDCTVRAQVGRQSVAVRQRTLYPADPEVDLEVRPARAANFGLWLRIPEWSRVTHIEVGGEKLPTPAPGAYLKLTRRWSPGDKVRLTFDFSPRVVHGQGSTEGRIAVYRGPLLLAVDKRFNPTLAMGALPALRAEGLQLQPETAEVAGPAPWVLVRAKTAGADVVLCDFASAGADKSEYAAWVPTPKP